MASPSCYVESLISSAKRLKISAPPVCQFQQRRAITSSRNVAKLSSQTSSTPRPSPAFPSLNAPSTSRLASDVAVQREEKLTPNNVRLPKAVQAVFLAPLKRAPTHGIPVCDLQIRSYSVRNLEIFTDFCLRAAYYLNLAAKGPVPLPRITERWTVPRSPFIFKKSQENFERVTVRRLVQIQDGHPETVALWLAYIQKHRYYGIGMKANVFEYGGLNVAKDLDAESERLKKALGDMPQMFLQQDEKQSLTAAEFEDMTHTQPFKAQWGAFGAMSGTEAINRGRKRFRRTTIDGKRMIEDAQLKLKQDS